ncbi:MAG TPA: hypothetical protein VLS45_04735 [Methylomicrobium sp.]|nr:hypothetical protein [Methylomicrobium sp.]
MKSLAFFDRGGTSVEYEATVDISMLLDEAISCSDCAFANVERSGTESGLRCADVDKWRTNADVVPSFSLMVTLQVRHFAETIFFNSSTLYSSYPNLITPGTLDLLSVSDIFH